MLAAITGSYSHFSCTEKERTVANGATYDVPYSKPFYPLGSDVEQRPDGLLDLYGGRVKFGLATFDGMLTYAGKSDLVPLSIFRDDLSNGPQGEYSFGGGMRPDGTRVGVVRYPTTREDYYVNSGIVSRFAPEGGLLLPMEPLPDEAPRLPEIARSLRAVRPFGGTPLAAALDDLYFVYREELSGAIPPPERRYIVLFTDGYPDDDFRQYGCDCAKSAEPYGACPPNEDPQVMSCPYPTPEDAARHLRCGYDPNKCDSLIAKLFIVSFSASDAAVRARMQDIAAAGGGSALFANSEQELVEASRTIMETILADSAR